MNIFRVISTVSRKGFLLAISALVALGTTFSFPASLAFAAPPDPQLYGILNLTKSHKRINKALIAQQTNLGTANDIAASIQNLITVAGSHAIDTTDISSALATFQAQVVLASSSNTIAANILAIHNGFDDSGNVTDPVAAKQTITDATNALQAAHVVLLKATNNMCAAFGSWQKANPVVKQIDSLQQAYANKLYWLNAQQADLVMAGTVETNVQNLISVAHSNGISISPLTKALTAFQSQLTEAQSSHTTAANVLSAHAGFDDAGNVTDLDAAATTVLTADQSLLAAQIVLKASSAKLFRAVEAWRLDKGIMSKSPVYATLTQAQSSIQDFHSSVNVENASPSDHLINRLRNLLQAVSKEI